MASAKRVHKFYVLISSLLILASVFSSISGKAEEALEPEIGTGTGTGTGIGEIGTGTGTGTGTGIGTGTGTGTGTVGYDPAQIVAKALLCFHDKYIYSSCEESYRLTESGNLDVPADKIEIYCGGPCLTETNLVLNCIENILTTFVFYNKATIQDVRATIHAGCGYGPERGNFDVAEHIQAEESNTQKIANRIVAVLGLMAIGHGLMYM